MTWEWVVIVGGIYFVIHAIGEVERHAATAAESLVKIESAVEDMSKRIVEIEDEVASIRQQVAPRSKPWTIDDV